MSSFSCVFRQRNRENLVIFCPLRCFYPSRSAVISDTGSVNRNYSSVPWVNSPTPNAISRLSPALADAILPFLNKFPDACFGLTFAFALMNAFAKATASKRAKFVQLPLMESVTGGVLWLIFKQISSLPGDMTFRLIVSVVETERYPFGCGRSVIISPSMWRDATE